MTKHRGRKPLNFHDLTRTGHAWLHSTNIVESPFPVVRVSKRQIVG